MKHSIWKCVSACCLIYLSTIFTYLQCFLHSINFIKKIMTFKLLNEACSSAFLFLLLKMATIKVEIRFLMIGILLSQMNDVFVSWNLSKQFTFSSTVMLLMPLERSSRNAMNLSFESDYFPVVLWEGCEVFESIYNLKSLLNDIFIIKDMIKQRNAKVKNRLGMLKVYRNWELERVNGDNNDD